MSDMNTFIEQNVCFLKHQNLFGLCALPYSCIVAYIPFPLVFYRTNVMSSVHVTEMIHYGIQLIL